MFFFLLVCVAVTVVVGQHDHSDHSDHDHSGSVDANGTAWCIANANETACATFALSEAELSASLDSLCAAMSWMSACTVRRLCASGGVKSTLFCSAASLVADVCVADEGMSKMKGCAAFTTTCRADSAVKQCGAGGPFEALPSMPDSMKTKADVLAACSVHNMPGCETCTAAACAEPLLSLGTVCRAMEHGDLCESYNAMCSALQARADDDWTAVCGSQLGSGSEQPLMRMYFHGGFAEYVLFFEWVPRSGIQYFATLLVVFVAAQVSGFVKVHRRKSHAASSCHSRNAGQGADGDELNEYRSFGSNSGDDELNCCDRKPDAAPASAKKAQPRDFGRQLSRRATIFALTLLSTTIDYSLMLIAMTFNAGLFVTVVVSIAFAQAAFGPSDSECH